MPQFVLRYTPVMIEKLTPCSQVPGMKLIQPMIRKEEQQSDRFLDYFYKKCASSLYAPLLENVPEHKNVTSMSLPGIDPVIGSFTPLTAFPLELSRAHSDLYLYLCDLLCGFMLQHSYQSHFFVLGNNLASRVASLLYAREKHLRLGTLFILSFLLFTHQSA
jgi:protein phosphatase 4 regulatory subunit 3